MSDSTSLCDVCCRRHISKPTTVWCRDCDEGLCQDCKEYHSFLKVTRHHHMISFNEYQTLPRNVLEIRKYCAKHEERFKTFCKTHGCPCCKICLIEKHNNCKDLIEIEENINDGKFSARLTNLQDMLDETVVNVKKLQISRQKNLTSLQEDRKKIENEIVQTRIKINNHLDKLQADLIQDLYEKEARETHNIQQVLNSLEEREVKLMECQNMLINIKKHASEVQLNLSMKQIEIEIVKNKEFVQSIIDSKSLRQAVLILKTTVDTEYITSSIPYIGKLDIEYSLIQVCFTKRSKLR